MLSIDQVFDALRQHLAKRTACLRAFAQYQYQSEGWLKAETIALLDRLKRRHQILALDREVQVRGQSKIDLAVQLNRARHWIELKHWYVGQQKGQRWRPVDFISELESECEKFEAVRAKGRAWVAALVTPRPTPFEWSTAVRQFNRDNSPWRLQPVDDPRRYPTSYFLGVLRVRGLDA